MNRFDDIKSKVCYYIHLACNTIRRCRNNTTKGVFQCIYPWAFYFTFQSPITHGLIINGKKKNQIVHDIFFQLPFYDWHSTGNFIKL